VTEREAIHRARTYFLREDNSYGCAETTLIVLQEAYQLPNPTDSSAAMALNGGVAWSGGLCGAVTGAAMAVGRLAAQREADHREAKRISRQIVRRLMEDFHCRHGVLNCRDLTHHDISISEQHQAFIESGIWRDTCMRQIEFSIQKLVSLKDKHVWKQTLEDLQ